MFSPLFKLIPHIYTTITIHSLFLSAYNLFASRSCTLFCTQLRCSNTQLHSRLTELQLTIVCFVLLFCSPTTNVLEVEGSRSRLLENSIATACICASSYMSSVILVVGDLFEKCLVYLCRGLCFYRFCLLVSYKRY